uniref:EGF-like domain-containing protein n=1 Tax=Plectus sambesii TaxID=2011161 RepID=A0A914VYL8_9BILA
MFPLLLFGVTVNSVCLTGMNADNPFADGVASQLVSVGSPCDSYPCWNDGGCLPAANDSYTCLCKEGFVGEHCELRTLKTCWPNSCPRETSCFVDGGDIECVPARLRNILLPCDHNLCRNSGDCRLMKAVPRCFCSHPYHGTFCEDSPFGNPTIIHHTRAPKGGSFVVGAAALLASALISAIIVVLMCNWPNCACYLLLPYRNYDRWRSHDNSTRSVDHFSNANEFDNFVVPLQRLELMRERRSSEEDGQTYMLGVHRSMASSETKETIAPACSPIDPLGVSVASRIT